MKKTIYVNLPFITSVALFLLMSGCKVEINEKEFLQKVLSNLEKINSATYYYKNSAYAPFDTSAYAIQYNYFKEYINPSDTSVGAIFVKLMHEDTTKMTFCYDGIMKASIDWDKKTINIDDFQHNTYPFRVVWAPFIIKAKALIQYALETKDSIKIETKDFGDSIQISLSIYDHVMELVGKLTIYETPLGSKMGEVSNYDIWVNKSNGLPYKIVRDLPHNKSIEEIQNLNLNKIKIEDFKALDYIPNDFKSEKQTKQKPAKLYLEGKVAPDWVLSNVDSITLELNNLKSKVLMIQFTSINCGPCLASIPFLNKLATEFDPKEFDFVAIEAHTKNSLVLKHYQDKNGVNYKFLMSTNDVTKKYQIKSFPVFFLLDKNRVIRKIIKGYGVGTTDEEIIDAIKELI